jgi:EAL domain-containing protein (putative c-di-GMP-specific phosphodiesterase class I)
MTYPALQSYLKQLDTSDSSTSRLWVDAHGRVQGRFLKCSLTSIFQAVVNLETEEPYGFDAYSHSYSPTDRGLSIWQLLMNGASDDESIELDRLGRTLHVINFFRQHGHEEKHVVIDVHDRLLTAVGSNHGAAFRRIVSSLEIPQHKIILQLPAAKSSQSWALSQVIDNYKLNGFQVATKANSIAEAIFQINLLHPTLVRLDITKIGTGDKLSELIKIAKDRSTKILFSRVEHPNELDLLRGATAQSGSHSNNLLVQGPLISLPQPELASTSTPSIRLGFTNIKKHPNQITI